MAGMIAIGLALAVSASGEGATLRPVVRVQGPELRVVDLVDLHGARLPQPVLMEVVARLPRGAGTFEMPAVDLVALVRRRVPGMRVAAPVAATVRISAIAAPAEAEAGRQCFRAAVMIRAGAALSAGDVVGTECRARAASVALRYDAAGLAVAGEAIPAGRYLGRLAALPRRTIGKGATLMLRSVAGPVTVERPVTALQPGHTGTGLFVRDPEGKVFAAPLDLVATEHDQ